MSFSGRHDETKSPNVGTVHSTTSVQTTNLPQPVVMDATTLVPSGIDLFGSDGVRELVMSVGDVRGALCSTIDEHDGYDE